MIAPEAATFFAVQGIQNFDGFDEQAPSHFSHTSLVKILGVSS